MNKSVIGMVHLKALPTAPHNELSMEEIFLEAKADLLRLEKAGIKEIIVENLFDIPYLDKLNIETVVAYTSIFTKLKEISSSSLGVNIHATNGVEEIIIAELCSADFIRVENITELRMAGSGIMYPTGAKLLRKAKELNSKVKIFADVNVKHSSSLDNRDLDELLKELISYNVDRIILTGFETGVPPRIKDVEYCRSIIGNNKLLVGSGVNEDNISEYLKFADGVIVGSSIKEDGKIENKVSISRTKSLLENM